ncbi:class IIb bacteriocin, lactobin A/cerein 7B family [Yeosuana sp. AK3]|nr:class IIb bacteriocin, lactobin A/cerein 7B family [Flavobacteriales bacterium]
MKNLENFGVQEMNAQELVCIDGGGFLAWILGAMAGIAHGQSQYIDEYGNYYPKQY